MSLEVISIGLLSKMFENLKKTKEKKAVADAFGLNNPMILESWMHSFAHLRNICAHHGRLWNRRLTTIPQLPNNPKYTFLKNVNFYQNKIYGILSCITYVLQTINPGHTFNQRLKTLLASCPNVSLKDMGFPQG